MAAGKSLETESKEVGNGTPSRGGWTAGDRRGGSSGVQRRPQSRLYHGSLERKEAQEVGRGRLRCDRHRVSTERRSLDLELGKPVLSKQFSEMQDGVGTEFSQLGFGQGKGL